MINIVLKTYGRVWSDERFFYVQFFIKKVGRGYNIGFKYNDLNILFDGPYKQYHKASKTFKYHLSNGKIELDYNRFMELVDDAELHKIICDIQKIT